MIGYLRGVVLVRDAVGGTVVLDVGGVGYQVIVSWQTFTAVAEVGEETELWIHTHVREDTLALFGFATPEEKRMFQLLTSVPQVGPKNAIGVLGGFPLSELIAAIIDGQRATLERIPGVGKRTAERILLDLKEKLEPLRAAVDGGASAPQSPSAPKTAAIDEDARAVLVNLGWKPKAVDKALVKAHESEPDESEDLDGLVRRTLALLMAR